MAHGYCKHIKFYKKRINQLIYGKKFTEQVITSFNNCYEFVIELSKAFPEIIGDYDKLDKISEAVLLTEDKHYTTETIHRAYRKAVENQKITESDQTQIRKEKTEQIMHDINKWSPKTYLNYQSQQTQLFDNGRGLEK